MFDAPVDAWYVWLGVGVVSVATLGVALGMPTAAPPDAAAAADAIDGVATSPPGSFALHGIDADELWIDRQRIGLRNAGGSAHATVTFGPITPATTDEDLAAVLDGQAPSTVFDDPDDLKQTATASRGREASWQRAPADLGIRRVTWEGVDVLLVG